MKKLLALILICTLLFSGCSITSENNKNNTTSTTITQNTTAKIEETLKFSDMDNPELLDTYKDQVYSTIIDNIDSDKYFIEDIQATYVSQEYIDEMYSNSQENIYFGYTLSELDEQFTGKRYIFTTSDDGKTVVQEFEKYDDTYEQIIKNVAVGAGVILFCVTVSAITGGLGAEAVSIVFSTAAVGGVKMSLASAGIGAIISGGTTYIETGDINQSLKSASLEASNEFKWGAIFGTIAGGIKGTATVKNLLKYNVVKNGLTLKQAAKIQRHSKYSAEIIKQFHSMDEYKIYKKAGSFEKVVNGNKALIRKIDLKFESELSNGIKVTNLEKMKRGDPPLDKKGKPYQLHHIGQKSDGSLAILTEDEHLKNSKILHPKRTNSEVAHDSVWNTKRKDFWKSLAKILD